SIELVPGGRTENLRHVQHEDIDCTNCAESEIPNTPPEFFWNAAVDFELTCAAEWEPALRTNVVLQKAVFKFKALYWGPVRYHFASSSSNASLNTSLLRWGSDSFIANSKMARIAAASGRFVFLVGSCSSAGSETSIPRLLFLTTTSLRDPARLIATRSAVTLESTLDRWSVRATRLTSARAFDLTSICL